MLARWLAALAIGAWALPAAAAPPSVIFILLDTTRADRLSAWGNSRPTTPVLDQLAARGVRFDRHFANSHATRPSMPQLMSGRYYHQNVLGSFQPDAHPREMSFARTDPTAMLLPEILHARGYATAAVSAHTWVVAKSEFGRHFDRFELLPFSPKEAHGDAAPLVDRAIALWRDRDRSRPLFLYLHFMDMHIPRRRPETELRFPVPGYDWRERFRPSSEPLFGRRRRRWSRADATDFTALDRAYYTAVYDTRLQYTDEQIARLIAAVRADDPELQDTVVVVTADHGEELGEEGRIEHTASLGDGVQHVPWIVAGAQVAPGRRCDLPTEHVDVVPSLLSLVDVPLPPGVTVDGMARLGPDGRPTRPCGGPAAYYAWEDYRAVRQGHYLLEERLPDSFEARCGGQVRLYRVDGLRRRLLAGPETTRRTLGLRERLRRRLAALEARYRENRYGTPTAAFVVRTEFWRVGDPPRSRCVIASEDTPRGAFSADGWLWSGRGVTMLSGPAIDPLAVRLDAPSGTYGVEAAAIPVPPRPRLFGLARWRREAFLPTEPSAYLPLGEAMSHDGVLHVALPPSPVRGHHILGLRLTPPGASAGGDGAVDVEQRERLKALGYVD